MNTRRKRKKPPTKKWDAIDYAHRTGSWERLIIEARISLHRAAVRSAIPRSQS